MEDPSLTGAAVLVDWWLLPDAGPLQGVGSGLSVRFLKRQAFAGASKDSNEKSWRISDPRARARLPACRMMLCLRSAAPSRINSPRHAGFRHMFVLISIRILTLLVTEYSQLSILAGCVVWLRCWGYWNCHELLDRRTLAGSRGCRVI